VKRFSYSRRLPVFVRASPVFFIMSQHQVRYLVRPWARRSTPRNRMRHPGIQGLPDTPLLCEVAIIRGTVHALSSKTPTQPKVASGRARVVSLRARRRHPGVNHPADSRQTPRPPMTFHVFLPKTFLVGPSVSCRRDSLRPSGDGRRSPLRPTGACRTPLGKRIR
jgi:hypothetical protein